MLHAGDILLVSYRNISWQNNFLRERIEILCPSFRIFEVDSGLFFLEIILFGKINKKVVIALYVRNVVIWSNSLPNPNPAHLTFTAYHDATKDSDI